MYLICIGGDSVRDLLRNMEILPVSAGRADADDEGAPARCTVGIVASSAGDFRAKLAQARQIVASGTSVNDPSGIHFEANPLGPESLGFIFPGQGSQYLSMFASFRRAFPGFDGAVRSMDDLWNSMFGSGLLPVIDGPAGGDRDAALTDTRNAQPAIGIMSAAMTGLLGECGIRPALSAGHSYGELAALHAAGVFGAEILLGLSRRRGELLAGAGDAAPGAMLAVRADMVQVAEILRECQGVVDVANINAPDQTVLSGEVAAIERAERMFEEREVRVVRLRTSGAFHSSLMAPALEPWGAFLKRAMAEEPGFNPAAAREVVSSVTAGPYRGEADEVASVLAEQLVRPVRWVEVCERMYESGIRLFLEVGPGAVTGGLVRKTLGRRPHRVLATDPRDADPEVHFLNLLAGLASHGIPVRWRRFFDPVILESQAVVVARAGAASAGEIAGGAGAGHPDAHCQMIDSFFAEQERMIAAIASMEHGAGRLGALRRVMEMNGRVMADFLGAQRAAMRLEQRGGGALMTAPPMPVVADAVAAQAPAVAEAAPPSSAVGADEVEAWLRVEICNITGFPPEYIKEDTVFDVDLALDSITIMQLLVRMIKKFPALEEMGDRLKKIRSFGDVKAVVGPSRAAPAAESPVGGGGGRVEEICQFVRNELSTITGYPLDMIGPETSFDNDLGVDSITVLQLLSRSIRKYPEIERLGEKLKGIRSINAMKELLVRAGAAIDAPAKPEDAAPTSVVSSESAATGRWRPYADWLVERLALYAGVPTSAITPSSDFFKDLKIDIFAYEKLIADFLKNRPEIAVAGRELVNATALDELRVLVEGILGETGAGRAEALGPEPVNRYLRVEQPVHADIRGPLPAGVIMAGSGGALYDRFLAELRSAGAPVLPLRCGPGGWSSEGMPGAAARMEDVEGLRRIIAGHDGAGAAPAVMFLACGGAPEGNFEEWRDSLECAATGAFVLAKALVPRDGGAARASLFAVVEEAGSAPPWRAAAGVAKAAGREWKDVRALHVILEEGAGVSAPAIVGALARLPALRTYVWGPGGIRAQELARVPLEADRGARPRLALTSNSVVLLTGGADGITAELGCALAERYKCHIAALGRTPWPERDPYPGVDDDGALKKALFDEIKRDGAADARAIQARFRQAKRQKAMLRVARRVEESGGSFHYYRADATSGEELAAAIAAIRKEHRGIHGLVHGAGITDDNRIERKGVDSFRAVLHTKAHSVFHLRRLLDREPLVFAALMSSVASYTGTAGQTDYTAANEVLNATAHAWGKGAGYPVLAILWSVWSETGLASGGFMSRIEGMGLDGIPTETGVRLFLEELAYGKKGDDWVLFSPENTLQYVDGFNRVLS